MKYLIFSFALLVFSGCGTSERPPEIIVIKKLDTPLKSYSTAYRQVRNVGLQDTSKIGRDRWVSFVSTELFSSLRPYIINPSAPSKDSADLIVEAVVRPGRGFPRLGRHFDLIWEYIDHINIKFVDAKTHALVGEVEYNRGWFSDNAPRLLDAMINKLVAEN